MKTKTRGVNLYLTDKEANDLLFFLEGAWYAAPDSMPEDEMVARVLEKLSRKLHGGDRWRPVTREQVKPKLRTAAISVQGLPRDGKEPTRG